MRVYRVVDSVCDGYSVPVSSLTGIYSVLLHTVVTLFSVRFSCDGYSVCYFLVTDIIPVR